jgi:hypothetical protein
MRFVDNPIDLCLIIFIGKENIALYGYIEQLDFVARLI